MSQVFFRGGLAIYSIIGVIVIYSKCAVNYISKFYVAIISRLCGMLYHRMFWFWSTMHSLNSNLLPYL